MNKWIKELIADVAGSFALVLGLMALIALANRVSMMF